MRRLLRRAGRFSVLAVLMALASIAGLALTDRGSALAEASITFQPSPTAATCLSSSNIEVTIRDTNGLLAANGTPVTFATTMGYITTTRATVNGVVDGVLVLPTKQAGTANITVTALGATAQRGISVSCSAPSTAAPPAQVAPVAPAAPVSPPAITGAAAASMAVTVRNFSYTPASITAQVGQTVSVNVTNAGPSPHTFTIDGLTDSGSIANGASKTVTFTPTQARTYTFYCTIHGASVMSGTLTVTGGPGTGASTASIAPPAPAMPAGAPSGARYGY